MDRSSPRHRADVGLTAPDLGRPDTDLPAADYRDGRAWAEGPQVVYDRLATAAMRVLPHRLTGARALDVGAGTGSTTRELLRRGAAVVVVDRSPAMLCELRRQLSDSVPLVIGDICRLGIRDDTADVTVAAFVINHLADPVVGLQELRRVTRSGGRVLATTFGADDHPIKAAVDEVLIRYGFEHPAWYRTIKAGEVAPISTPAGLSAAGAQAGLRRALVESVAVDLSDLPVSAAIGYRLGLAHIAPFIASLDAAVTDRLRADLVATVAALPPLRLQMLVLTGRG